MSETSTQASVPRLGWWALAVFAVTLAFYLVTLCPGAAPGESARLVAQHTGLQPFPPLTHFLWGLLAKAAAAVPVGALAWRLNVVSALCGAAGVTLLFWLVAGLGHHRTPEERLAHYPPARVQLFSGLAAAGYLAVCVSFWISATRTYSHTFDVALLLATVALVRRYRERKALPAALAAALLCGVGATESATVVLMLPVFAAVTFYLMWQHGGLRPGPVLAWFGLFLLGFALYLLAAWQFCRQPAFAWSELEGWGPVLWQMLREQYLSLTRSIPRVGWLMVLIISVVPWLIVIAFPTQTVTRTAIRGSLLLRAVLVLLALLILYNFTLSPWALLGSQAMLVTPYVLVASWAGYLAGYWYLMACNRAHGGHPARRFLRKTGAWLLPALWLAAVVAGGLVNFRWADHRQTFAANNFARQVLADMGDRRWLISNGVIDDLLLINAAEQRHPLRLVNLSMTRQLPYQRYLASLFNEGRLQGVAQLGVAPLLNVWFSETPDIEKQVAIMSVPDLWYTYGFTPVPENTVYGGARDSAAVEPAALLERHQAFWRGLPPADGARAPEAGLYKGWNQWVASYLSKIANDLGVFLQDRERNDLAVEAYTQARRLDHQNISALLNLMTLSSQQKLPDQDALNRDFENLVNRRGQQPSIWSLSARYGYVRDSELYAQRGMAWALSGKSRMAVRELEHAMELGADKQQIQSMLASIYLASDQEERGEQAYRAILNEQPGNPGALLGLARLAMRNKDFASARGYLAELRSTDAPRSLVDVEEAVLHMLAGEQDEAKRKLQQAVKETPGNLKGWMALALLAQSENDQAALTNCLAVVTPMVRGNASAAVMLSQLITVRRDFKAARDLLNNALQSAPGNVQVLEQLVRLDVAEARRDQAEQHLALLLENDPQNALANMVLGSLQMAREQYALAESSYRVSLAKERTAPALNDLAWLLTLRGQHEEALALIEESLALTDTLAPAWDTKGVVLLKLNRLAEAETALQKALTLRPTDPVIQFHMAQLYASKGLAQDALKLAEGLLGRATEVSPGDFEQIRTFVGDLQKNL